MMMLQVGGFLSIADWSDPNTPADHAVSSGFRGERGGRVVSAAVARGVSGNAEGDANVVPAAGGSMSSPNCPNGVPGIETKASADSTKRPKSTLLPFNAEAVDETVERRFCWICLRTVSRAHRV